MKRIDLLGNDFGPSLLGSLGFSSKCIGHHFSLSDGQISYRLRRGHIRRKDYRDGESSISKEVLRSIGNAKNIDVETVAEKLRNELKRSIQKNGKKKVT